MLVTFAAKGRRPLIAAALALAATAAPVPLAAQPIESVDPDKALDSDLTPPAQQQQLPAAEPVEPYRDVQPAADPGLSLPPSTAEANPPLAGDAHAAPPAAASQGNTYKEDDLIGAAEGVFGKGAEGVAKMIQKILKDQGEPNAYIVGREAGGAIGIGLRYGSGTLYHKVEGQMPVYWTGPSIGFDVGANAASTFVLVYNLYDTEQLFERYPAGEGNAYAIGGLTASYLRKGDVVLIPIRVGAGLRLGVNAGYMKFSHKQRWLPF